MSSLLTKPLVQHHLSRVSPIQLRDFPLVIVSRPGGGGLKLYSRVPSCAMWYYVPLSAIQTASSLLPDCTMNALCRYLPDTVILPTTLTLGTRNLPDGANCARVAWSLKELEDDSDGTGGPCGSGGAGADCDGGGGPLSKSV